MSGGEWWAKLIILTYLIGSLFLSEIKGTNQAYLNNSFHHNMNFLEIHKTKKPITDFFLKLCLHYIYLD